MTTTYLDLDLPYCDHWQTPVELFDGSKVYVSGSAYRDRRPVRIDLGVYLDGSWKPDCVAFHIGWTDYGLPIPDLGDVLTVARMALEQARQGKRVEIGCIGAHGRTGTFLAILQVLAGMTDYRQAISATRRIHCALAIETDDQEWYVGLVANHVHGSPLPLRQVAKPAKSVCKTGKQKGKTGKHKH